MSAMCQTASGWVKWSAAPLAFRPPRGLAASLGAFGAGVTARLRARQFIEALRGAHKKCPGGSGGPGEPPESDPAPYGHWDDPALWMLMMH
jgi:hypothetical protein